jgi:hypothetical protein
VSAVLGAVVKQRSLKNFGVDTIDLLYQHFPDKNVPIEDVVAIMQELVHAGKAKYLGPSNADEDIIRRAQKNGDVPLRGVAGGVGRRALRHCRADQRATAGRPMRESSLNWPTLSSVI